jgi:hypothetical protein
MTALSRSRLESLAAAALAAPSADNRHVFRIEASATGLRLLATDEFRRSMGSRRILGLISLGAVFQNLKMRGARLGVHLVPDWHGDAPGDSVLIADLAASAMEPMPDPLEAFIEARHTNRRLRFKGPRLSAARQLEFSKESASIDGCELVWLDAPAARNSALRLIRRAEVERFRNRELHRELFESVRFDMGWRSSAAEGLPPGSLELPVFERPAFQALRRWSIQRAANAFGVDRFIGFRAADLPCRLAPHLGVVTATGSPGAAAIDAGQLLQRLWLRATLSGLSFQVFAASTLYALKGSTGIGQPLRDMLSAGWAELCPGGRPFVVFRMGWALPPSVRAGRPPLQDLVSTFLTPEAAAVDEMIPSR